VVIVAHASDQLAGFLQHQSPDMVAIKYGIDDLQVVFQFVCLGRNLQIKDQLNLRLFS
jgi:hypothetical protein